MTTTRSTMNGPLRLLWLPTTATLWSTPLLTFSQTLPTPSLLDQTHSPTYIGNIILNRNDSSFIEQIFSKTTLQWWALKATCTAKYLSTIFSEPTFDRWIISYIASQTNHSGYRSFDFNPNYQNKTSQAKNRLKPDVDCPGFPLQISPENPNQTSMIFITR